MVVDCHHEACKSQSTKKKIFFFENWDFFFQIGKKSFYEGQLKQQIDVCYS